jgi:hypothetical protein
LTQWSVNGASKIRLLTITWAIKLKIAERLKLKMKLLRDSRLYLGEVGALVAGELTTKIGQTITRPTWSLARELSLSDGIDFNEAQANQLILDTCLLVGAWSMASILIFGCLGYAPENKSIRWDTSLALTVGAANVSLLALLIVLFVSKDHGSAADLIADYETLVAISLAFALVFRQAY